MNVATAQRRILADRAYQPKPRLETRPRVPVRTRLNPVQYGICSMFVLAFALTLVFIICWRTA